MTLKNRHIVLGITGGIAAYKSALLLRLLLKSGAEVQVIMTPHAKEFITPLTLSTLSRKPVISEFFTRADGSWNSHVELGLWADAMIIAPATASTIGKMANGIADNMLITSYLSCKSPVFLAPAMDLDMYAHPSTQRNLQTLRGYGNRLIEPASGFLASGLEGKGRMAEPETILSTVEAFFAAQERLKGKHILITAGPTYEKIDPVRFIGNYSSGKMGYAIAEACAAQGATVTLVSGPTQLSVCHPGITRIDTESAAEMYEAALTSFPTADVAILSAAVADFTPQTKALSKIKREKESLENLELTLLPTRDIAAALGRVKTEKQVLVGFALETDHEEANARLKLERKNLDFVVLNSLQQKGAGFMVDTNKVSIIEKNGIVTHYDLKPKSSVAADIVDKVVEYL